MTEQRNNPQLALMCRDFELLAELGRILNAWNTEFTRVAEEVQVRKIEEKLRILSFLRETG